MIAAGATPAADGALAIRAQAVGRRYGSTEALQGVDLTVRTGEIVALLGPNGAGKTTLIEILEGLRRRDGGTVSVLGCDPADADASWRGRVGAVLQLGTETDELTVEELLRSHANYYPAPSDVGGLLDALQLVGLEDRRVRALSGGQRRRLDLALGLVGDPELLFLDEPTTGLDADVRRSIWRLVRSLADEGTTVLLTTHYLEEVEQLAHRTSVLVDGRMVWSGETGALRATNRHDRVCFALRAPCTEADLPATIAQHSERRGEAICLTTADTTDMVSRLLGWAIGRPGGNPVVDLEIERAGIEDAYLELLRSHQPEAAREATDRHTTQRGTQ